MKIQQTHIAYVPTRDAIVTAAIDPVTKKPGLVVARTEEVLLAASAWVLRQPVKKSRAENLPPALRWLRRFLKPAATAKAVRAVTFHDGVRVEFAVRVFDDGAVG